MTAEDIKEAGIPIDNPDSIAVTMTESAIEYISENTSLTADVNDVNTIKALPACAKLFIAKYNELMSNDAGITSESLGGMSQSFDTANCDTLLMNLLNALLGNYVKSQFQAVPAVRRWDYGS